MKPQKNLFTFVNKLKILKLIKKIKGNHGGELEKHRFNKLYLDNGYKHKNFVQGPHNKIGLWKRKIESYKKQLELC